MNDSQNETEALLAATAECRTIVMGDCELALGDSPRWPTLRARLLNVFGTRGLAGRIEQIMATTAAAPNMR